MRTHFFAISALCMPKYTHCMQLHQNFAFSLRVALPLKCVEPYFHNSQRNINPNRQANVKNFADNVNMNIERTLL